MVFTQSMEKGSSLEVQSVCHLQLLSIWTSLKILLGRVNSLLNDSWLVVLGFNATLTAKVISWRSVTHVFPGFLTPVLTQLFFPKLPFPTMFSKAFFPRDVNSWDYVIKSQNNLTNNVICFAKNKFTSFMVNNVGQYL